MADNKNRNAVTCSMPFAGLGAMIAVVLSNEHNHSILWMALHGICSWFYVIYRAISG